VVKIPHTNHTNHTNQFFLSYSRYFDEAGKYWELKYSVSAPNNKPVFGIAMMEFLPDSNKTFVSKKILETKPCWLIEIFRI